MPNETQQTAPDARTETVSATEPASGKGWWLVALVLIVPAGWALTTLALSLWPGSDAVPSLRGVRLGMSAEQVRARFDSGARAGYRTEISGSDLRLVRDSGGSLDREAVFEIHEGMLVAVRLDLPASAPESDGPPIELTTMSVLARDPISSGRVRIRLLSRTCPTHASEVSELIEPSR